MQDDLMRVHTYGNQGFCCSQILMMMGLEDLERENPDLVRAISGLCGGTDHSGKTCGALTGGLCLLALYVGRGAIYESEARFAGLMQNELLEWIEEQFVQTYGSKDCVQILEGNPINRVMKCPQIVLEVYQKVREILESYGHSMSGLKED